MRRRLPPPRAIGGVIRGSVALRSSLTASVGLAFPVASILVAVLALSACGGSSEPPAADTATVEQRLPSGLTVRDHAKVMKWVNERLDACAPLDDGTFRGPDYVWGCIDDRTANACRDWVDTGHHAACVDHVRYLLSEVLAFNVKGWRTPEQMRLPSGLTVGDYPEAMAWVTKRRKTCAGSASLEKCMSDDERYGVIPTCRNWFGGVSRVDPENPKCTDCVEDMRYFVREMLQNVEDMRYFVREMLGRAS
jgi:hypothetical protein